MEYNLLSQPWKLTETIPYWFIISLLFCVKIRCESSSASLLLESQFPITNLYY